MKTEKTNIVVPTQIVLSENCVFKNAKFSRIWLSYNFDHGKHNFTENLYFPGLFLENCLLSVNHKTDDCHVPGIRGIKMKKKNKNKEE